MDANARVDCELNDVGADLRHSDADCFQFLSCTQDQDSWTDTAETAMIIFEEHYLSLDLTVILYNAIKGFSISRQYNSLLTNMEPSQHPNNLTQFFASEFLPHLFQFLQKSDSTKYLELYQHHQSEYDLFLREHIKACSPESQTSLFFALVSIYHELPIHALTRVFHPFDKSHFGGAARAIFLEPGIEPFGPGYLEYLSDFLRDPKRSQESCATPELFAQAAKHCLLYLCDWHTMSAQKCPPRISAQQRMSRIHTPWKWHRRLPRDDFRGLRNAPQLWLLRPTGRYRPVSQTLFFQGRAVNLIDIHSRIGISLDPPQDQDPAFMYRINPEKYYLALIYLNQLLPRAAKLDELVNMCQRLTLASRSQDFSRKSAQARSNMRKYAAQWG